MTALARVSSPPAQPVTFLKDVRYRVAARAGSPYLVYSAEASLSGANMGRYSPTLIKTFGIAAIASMIGAVGTVAGAVAGNDALKVSAAIILAAGAVIVALTLVRGQHIDEARR